MRLIALALAAMVGLLLPASAQAACTLTRNTNATLAPSSSYAVQAGQVAQVVTQPSLSCTGALLSVLSYNYARAGATSANGFRLRSDAGDSIAYHLSADPGGTFAFDTGATIDYFDPTLIGLLNNADPTVFTPPMYVTLADMPNVAAGTYTDIVTINWSWRICSGVGVGGLCVIGYTGSGTTTLRITFTVGNDCRIEAPDIAFGSAPLASGFQPVTQAVRLDCTKGSRFTIAFTAGDHGTARPWRALSDPLGNKLYYNLYRADGVTIWDETNPLSDPRAGTGNTLPTLTQTYIAKIDPTQPTPPPGLYRDTITVVVGF